MNFLTKISWLKLLLIGFFFTIVIWLMNNGISNQKLNAEQYYSFLLSKKGYTVNKVDDELMINEENSIQHLNISTLSQSLSKPTFDIRINIIFQNLLNGILEDLLPKYKLGFENIYVAEFPLEKLNARTIKVSNGSYLILINSGLRKSLYEWAKIIINASLLLETESLKTSTLESARFFNDFKLEPDTSLYELAKLFKESIINCTKEGIVPFFPDLAKDGKSKLVADLTISTLEFIICHEYAHIFLGHLDSIGTTENHELEADMIGADICLNNSNRFKELNLLNKTLGDFDIRLSGIFYAVNIFDLIGQEGSFYEENFEPDLQFYYRSDNVKNYISTHLGIDWTIYDGFNFIYNGLTYLRRLSIIDPLEEELTDKLKIINQYHQAIKEGNEKSVSRIIKQNKEIFHEWAPIFLQLAESVSKGPTNGMSMSWSGTDFMNSVRYFKLAYSIEKTFLELNWGSPYENLTLRGQNIVFSLKARVKHFENKNMDHPEMRDYVLNDLFQIKEMNELLNFDPYLIESKFEKGNFYRDNENLDLALKEFEEILELNPLLSTAHYNLGLIYFQKEEYQKSIDSYSEAIEIDPFYILAYFNRGDTYRILKKHDLGILDYNKIIELDSTYANAYYNRAIIFEELNQKDNSISDYTQAIKYKPNFEFAYLNRANLYLNKGLLKKSVQDYEQFLNLAEDNAKFINYTNYVKKSIKAIKEYESKNRD